MTDDPLAMLDDVIAKMDRERRDVVAKLRVASGAAAETCARALKTLDDKLVEVRMKRNELLVRRERMARIKEIAAELARLHERRAATTDEAEIADPRARYERLVAEAESIRAPRTNRD